MISMEGDTMRPRAIVNFERVYLVSLALVLVQQVIAFIFLRDMYSRFASGMGEVEGSVEAFGAIMVIATLFGVLIAIGVPLLFWWLAARKRQEFAKWVLLVLSVLSVASWLFALVTLVVLPTEMTEAPGMGGFRTVQAVIVAVDAVSEILGVVALVHLFRREAEDWFRSRGPTNADVFR